MFKDRWNSMNSFRRRVFAVSLAAAVATTTLNVGSLAVEASNNVRGREIVAFEELPEDVADQKLPIGGKKSDLNLPDELNVLLYTEEAEEEETTEGVQKLEEETTMAPTERPSEQPSDTEETPSSEAPSEESRPEEQVSADSVPAETVTETPVPEESSEDSGSTDTDESVNNEDTSDTSSTSGKAIDKAFNALKGTFAPVKAYAAEPDEDEGSVSEDEAAEEPVSEAPSESAPRSAKAGNTDDEAGSSEGGSGSSEGSSEGSREAASGTAEEEASEERSEEATEAATESSSGTGRNNTDRDKDENSEKKKVRKLSDGEEVTLTEVRWKLDRDKSQYRSRFQAVQAGDVFYFVPDIWAYGLKTDADLPEIKVTIVEEGETVSKNSVSEDGVSGNSVSGDNVSGNQAAFDQFMIVDGVKVSVTAPEGVFPEDAVLKVRRIDDDGANLRIEQALKEDMGLSDEVVVNGVKPDGSEAESDTEENNEDGSSVPTGEALNYISFDITITDVSGNEIQPNTEHGKANVTFSQASIVSDYLAAPGEETEGKLAEETNDDSENSVTASGSESRSYINEEGQRVYVLGDDSDEGEEAAGSGAKKTLRVYHGDDGLDNIEKLPVSLNESESAAAVDADHFSTYVLVNGTTTPPNVGDTFGDFKIECSGAKLEITVESTLSDNTRVTINVIPAVSSKPQITITQKEGIESTNQELYIEGGLTGNPSDITLKDLIMRGNEGYVRISDFKDINMYLEKFKLEREGYSRNMTFQFANSKGNLHLRGAHISGVLGLEVNHSELNCFVGEGKNNIIKTGGGTNIGLGSTVTFQAEEGKENCKLTLEGTSGVFDSAGSGNTIIFKSGNYVLSGPKLDSYYTDNAATYKLLGGKVDASGITGVKIISDPRKHTNYHLEIEGGTHVLSEGFLGLDHNENSPHTNSNLTIKGGSFKVSGEGITITQIYDYNGIIKYLYTILVKDSIGNAVTNKKLGSLKSANGAALKPDRFIDDYGVNDCYTDANGRLYLWYPTEGVGEDNKLYSLIMDDGTKYVWDSVNGGSSYAELNKIAASEAVTTFMPYDYITDIELDNSKLLAGDNYLKDVLTFKTKNGKTYTGSSVIGANIEGLYDRLRDIDWTLSGGATARLTDNKTYNVKLNIADSTPFVLTATIPADGGGIGTRRTWSFFIPEYKAVSDIKSSAGTDPVIINPGTSYTNAKNSSKKYTIFNTEYTVDPQDATAVADNSTNWTWEITTPDGISNTLNMEAYTPNQLGEYTLKATIPNGISEIPVKNFEKTFTVSCKKSISNCAITVESPVAFKGKGTPVKAAVTVKDGTTTLTEGTDYTLEYSDNTDVTTPTAPARVTITGKGKYYNSVNEPFTIAEMPVGTITMQNLNLKFDTFQTADQVCKYVNGDNTDTIAVVAGKKADGSADITGDDLLYIVSDKFYSTASELLSVYPKDNAAWKKQQTDGYARTVANKKNYIYAMIKETNDLYTVISTKQIVDDRIKPTTVSINSASVTGTTGTVTVQGKDEFSGIGAYYVLAVDKNGGTPPSSEEDIRIKGVKSTSSTVTIPNLSYANKYTFYAVVEDRAGNLSNVIKTRDSVIGKGSMSSKITVDKHSYDKLQGKQEIDDYYKEPKEIKITANADNGIKKIEYFITDKFYSSESAIDAAAKDTKGSGNAAFQTSSWATYNDSSRPYLVRNKLNYIYVRVTDNGGFTYYLSSKGIWEDEIVPKVTSNTATPKDKTATGQVKGKDNESGIKYYYTMVKKESESAPKKPEDVKSGGTKSEDGKYDLSGLSPNTKYVIYSVIEDKAGNLSEIKVTKMTTKKDSASANKAKAAAAAAAAAAASGANGKGDAAGKGSNVDKRTAGASSNKAGEDSSAEGIRDGVPYIEDASDGITIGRAETSGWDRIEKEVGKASAPAQVFINMNGTTVVPAAAFDQIKDRDITCYYIMNDDVTWTVNGLSFTNKTKDIDFRVRKDTKNIPSKLINEIADVYPHTNLTLEHDGEFGFTAILTVDVGKENSGMYANLYYYDEPENSLDFEETVEVDGGGRASFEFLHASDYTIIVRGDALTDKTASLLTDDLSSTGDGSGTGSGGPRNVSRNLGNIWLLVVSIICFLLCGLILFMPDRNKKRRRYARA